LVTSAGYKRQQIVAYQKPERGQSPEQASQPAEQQTDTGTISGASSQFLTSQTKTKQNTHKRARDKKKKKK
jgi:hypothetical protein